MKLDRQYRERFEAITREARAGLSFYKYVGHEEWLEDEDFEDYLARKGIAYQERVIMSVAIGAEHVRELRYHQDGYDERFAYLFRHTSAVSSEISAQAVYIFGQPVPDEQLAQTLRVIQVQEFDLDQCVYQRQRELDREYPPYWRLMNENWKMSILAYYLVRRGWTQEVEATLIRWGAYHSSEIVGFCNPLVQSLCAYGELIKQLEHPEQYIRDLLASAGPAGREYRQFVV